MASRAVIPPKFVAGLSVSDASSPRQIADAVSELSRAARRDRVRVDLTVGQNRIPHALGRSVEGYGLTPTVADATFAHAIDQTNPHPERELWVTVVGIAQPDARIEMW